VSIVACRALAAVAVATSFSGRAKLERPSMADVPREHEAQLHVQAYVRHFQKFVFIYLHSYLANFISPSYQLGFHEFFFLNSSKIKLYLPY
jgi:hypothetical protein